MQGIYDYIPLTICVSRVYNFAAILYLQFILHVMLCPMLNVCYISALSAVCVQCSYLNSCFPGMLLRSSANDFEVVPVAPVITGVIPNGIVIIIIIIIIIIITT